MHYLVAPIISERSSLPTVEHAVTQPDERFELSIKDGNDFRMFFRVKRTTVFGKVFETFAGKLQREVRSYRFLFDGVRIEPQMTPGEVGACSGARCFD